jgi:uncharacterized phage protein (TIGR02216 family)
VFDWSEIIQDGMGVLGLSPSEFWNLTWWEYTYALQGYAKREKDWWEQRYLVSWYDGINARSDPKKNSFNKWRACVMGKEAERQYVEDMKSKHRIAMEQLAHWDKVNGI